MFCLSFCLSFVADDGADDDGDEDDVDVSGIEHSIMTGWWSLVGWRGRLTYASTLVAARPPFPAEDDEDDEVDEDEGDKVGSRYSTRSHHEGTRCLA